MSVKAEPRARRDVLAPRPGLLARRSTRSTTSQALFYVLAVGLGLLFVAPFLVLFLLIYLLVKALERLLAAMFDKLNLERLDRAIGLFLGLAEGLLLVGVLLFLLNWLPFVDTRGLLRGSLFARFLSPLLPSPERLFGHV